jgi:integrase
MLGIVASGSDPAVRKSDLGADTLGAIVEDYLQWAARELRPGSFAETQRHLRVNWKPLHAIALGAVRRRDVAQQIKHIELASGRVTAGHARAQLSALFNWAVREGHDIAGNPVTGTNRPAGKPRDRVLSNEELAAVWRACADLGTYGRAVRLLILTGQRREEVGGMTWAEVRGDLWTIPSMRTKNGREHSVPLTKLALGLIGRRTEGRVFPDLGAWDRNKARLNALVRIPPFVIHDIRRSVATGMAEIGVFPYVVEAVLNHVSGHKAGIVSVYNKAKYADEVRDALDRWSARVSSLVR